MADFLKIDDVLSHLKLSGGMKAAEFGCGSADFAIALAKKLPKGKVYALDIQEERLSALTHKLSHGNIKNVVAALCDLETPGGSGLKNTFLDVVLIPNLLFQAKNKSAILIEVKRVLKSKGQLLMLDWFGKAWSVDHVQLKNMAQEQGFSLKKEFMAGDYHFGLLFVKK